MKSKYYVKDKNGHYLVKGNIDNYSFDGKGKPFLFSKKQSKLLCDCFDCSREKIND